MDDLTRLILLFARTLISDRCCWASGALARDRLGRPVSALDEAAISWCALGAVYRISDGDVEVFQRASDTLDASARALYGVGIRAVNDSPSPFAHLAVLGAFDHAVDGPIETRGWPPDLLIGLGLADEPVGPGRAARASPPWTAPRWCRSRATACDRIGRLERLLSPGIDGDGTR